MLGLRVFWFGLSLFFLFSLFVLFWVFVCFGGFSVWLVFCFLLEFFCANLGNNEHNIRLYKAAVLEPQLSP